MSTAAIAAASLSAQSAVAQRTACEAMLNSFDSKHTTLSAMQEYASCVNLLHPVEISADSLFILKVLVTIGLASAMFVGAKEYRATKDWLNVVVFSFAAMLCVPAAIALLGLFFTVLFA